MHLRLTSRPRPIQPSRAAAAPARTARGGPPGDLRPGSWASSALSTVARTFLPLFLPVMLSLASPILAAAAPGTASGAVAQEPGIQWLRMSVDDALALSGRTGKPVLLDLYASWCEPCKKLDQEVWATSTGAQLGQNTIPIHVDFDSDYGQTLKRRFNILGLPCVIVLDRRGLEVDRLMGFDRLEPWIEQIRPLIDGVDPIPGLEKKLAAEPNSPELLLEIGRRRLFRGDEAGAFRDFLRLIALDPPPEAAAEAFFLLGRYYQRVLEKPASALPYWKHIARDYPETGFLGGAVAWALDGYKALGRTEDGLTWAEGIALSRVEGGEIDYIIAAWARENKVRSPLALAHARKAKDLGVEAEDLDEIVAYLQGNEKASR